MSINLTVDDRKFRQDIERFARITNRDKTDVLREQTAILSGQLAKRFPPKTKGEGKEAIENDMMKVIFPMREQETLQRWDDDLQDVIDIFDPQGIRIDDWMDKNRNKRTYRTRYIKEKRQIAGRKFSMRLHTTEKAFKKYLARTSKSVGQLKSGWVAGAVRWPGAKKPAAWIMKQNIYKTGKAVDRLKSNGNGYLMVQNNLPYASRWTRIQKFVEHSRTRSIHKAIAATIRKNEQEYNRRAA